MKEETLLEQKFGRRIDFKVPDGYFDQLEKSVMNALPEQKEKRNVRLRRVWRPLAGVACLLAAAFVSVMIYFNRAEEDAQVAHSESVNVPQSVSSDYIIDEVSDFAMLDNDDFYSYVAGE